MSAHLSEIEVEALATGEAEDEISERALEHLEGCELCQLEVERESEEALALRVALRRAAPEVPGLSAMIAAAMAEARERVGERAPEASPRSMVLGAALGMLSVLFFAILARPEGDLVATLQELGRNAWVLLRTADRLAGLIPGGWATLSLGALALTALLLRPLRALSGWGPGNGQGARSAGGAAPLLALLGFLAVGASGGTAAAWELEGSWPSPDPRVTLDVEAAPTSVALRRAAESAGWGLVARLPEDPPVTMHLRETPMREALDALLGSAPLTVRHTGTLMVVEPTRADRISGAENSAVAAPAEEPSPSTPPAEDASSTQPRSRVHDRVTFGDDATVAAGEQVGDVATMGGDAMILGTAFGDVATMGGDARIEGEVVGDVVTMGGDIHVVRGARVHGQLSAMGGEIVVDDPESARAFHAGTSQNRDGRGAREQSAEQSERGDHVRTFSRGAVYHGLLFLLGLLFLGTSRGRFANLRMSLEGRWARHFATGFFVALASLALGFVLTVTIIGIPAALLLGVLLFLGSYLGLAVVASRIGEKVPLRFVKQSPVLRIAAGAVILFLLSRIPFLGPVFFVVFALIGLGAAAATRLGRDTH